MTDKSISVEEAAEALLRSRDKLWEAAREVARERGGESVNAADVHDILCALARES